MSKSVILPINVNPQLRSMTYYAYPLAILTAPERIGEVAAKVKVNSRKNDINDWNKTQGVSYNSEEKCWILTNKDKYLRNENACIYREITEDDFIEIEVLYHRYSEPWAAVNVFITDSLDDIAEADMEYNYKFGHFKYNGLSLMKKGKSATIPAVKFQEGYKLGLSIRSGNIEFLSGDEELRTVFTEQLNLGSQNKYYIGFQVKNNDASFYPWKYMNFIQLSANLGKKNRRIVFHGDTYKHWEFDIADYFLDKNRYTAGEISELGGVKYIEKMISNGCYVEIDLDQFYVRGRLECGRIHEYHQCLIYGFEKKVFKMLGFTNEGKVQVYGISYKDVKNSLETKDSARVKVIRYNQGCTTYKFDVGFVKKMLYEYLNSENSSTYDRGRESAYEGVYGISIYDELMTDKSYEIMLEDVRVAHILWEHKVLMCERIEYMIDGKLLQGDVTKLLDSSNKVRDMAYNLKNHLLKASLTGREEQMKSLVFDTIDEMKRVEEEYIRDLIKII
ncbi:MAG: hypothetical protein K6G63_00135 [Eubacterium sp.]|nr:hypothetical protein [Eubacterium sp.]